MPPQYLIDTDWVIDYLNDIERTKTRLEPLFPAGIAISVISIAELYDGIFGGADPARKEQELLAFLARGIDRLDVDAATATLFARERSRLRRAGTPIGDFDLLIGATALRHNLTLLSNNRRHFLRIPGLNLISA